MAAPAVTIKAIEATAVHRIQSGQVIVNLCSVVKELVENSLDAGASSIEVRFKNQGLDAIEVQDNGSGIAPHNYASLALKHYTSKLENYDDLDTLQTFGFRGEALSSMCALSRFAVTTCLAADVPRGRKLEFETSGQLAGTPSVVAAQKGTTVSVENLFWNLPVRRRELERNIKREWTKVVGLLNQYACIQTGVKFTITQQPTKGKKVVLFSTKGNAATRDNIINVFGAKTMGGLLALDLDLEMLTTRPRALVAFGDRSTNETKIRVVGYVSRPAHGQGRQTPDRQMFYVNGRPCKLPQFAQLFGEVYRSYNSAQSPFIFADIQLDTHLYDVNVSPDKQTILLHDQGRMLDTLRESLIELFEKQDITVPISQLSSSQKLGAFKRATPAPSSSPAPTTALLSSRFSATRAKSPQEEPQEEDNPTLTLPTKEQPADLPEQQLEEPAAEEPLEEDSLFVDDRDNITAPQHNEDSASEGQEDAQDDENSGINSSRSTKRTTGLAVHPRPPDRPSPEAVTIQISPHSKSKASAKRQRLATLSSSAANSSARLPKRKTKAPLPSFGGRLTQMFSAARARNSSAEVEEDDVEEDADDAEEEEEATASETDERDQELMADEDAEEPAGSPESGPEDAPLSGPLPMEDVVEEEEEEDVEMADGQDDQEQEDQDQDQEDQDQEDQDQEDQDLPEDDNEDEQVDTPCQSAAAEPASTDEDRRNALFLRAGGSKKRYETLRLVQNLKVGHESVRKAASQVAHSSALHPKAKPASKDKDGDDDGDFEPETAGGLDDTEDAAEAKLALTIVKSDFAKMRIVGQFNLGFILAVREAGNSHGKEGKEGKIDNDGNDGNDGNDDSEPATNAVYDDELFIIDQHASDEKYNFERLQASTVVQSQRLVQPKRLELTAVEEEIVLENLGALSANGFEVDAELDGSVPVGSRCRLQTLPLSRETTFDLSDLEELIALLGDHHQREATAMVRPAKVRKMFAMRACRSSIMIGKALSRRQMSGVLSHMGEMDKPWNCPHGRPTMRHLCSLGAAWDKTSRTWDDDDGSGSNIKGAEWAKFLKKRRRAAQRGSS